MVDSFRSLVSYVNRTPPSRKGHVQNVNLACPICKPDLSTFVHVFAWSLTDLLSAGLGDYPVSSTDSFRAASMGDPARGLRDIKLGCQRKRKHRGNTKKATTTAVTPTTFPRNICFCVTGDYARPTCRQHNPYCLGDQERRVQDTCAGPCGEHASHVGKSWSARRFRLQVRLELSQAHRRHSENRDRGR